MRFLLCLLVVTATVHGQDSASSPQLEPLVPKKSSFQFQLLPKAFSTAPQIEMTAYSERTGYGRTLREASAENPVYYIAQSQGFQPMGSAPGGDRHLLDATQIDTLLRDSLAKSGFTPATDSAHSPELVLFYYWGAHAGVNPKDALDAALLTGDSFFARSVLQLRDRDILERAKLIGGPAYVQKIAREMAFGSNPADYSSKHQHLRYQSENNLYYVVVSAYDHDSLARGERRLAWRTTLTVNDQGVALRESLPPLIASGANFFGRDTGESVALERRLNRNSVTLGPLMIIGEATPSAQGTK